MVQKRVGIDYAYTLQEENVLQLRLNSLPSDAIRKRKPNTARDSLSHNIDLEAPVLFHLLWHM